MLDANLLACKASLCYKISEKKRERNTIEWKLFLLKHSAFKSIFLVVIFKRGFKENYYNVIQATSSNLELYAESIIYFSIEEFGKVAIPGYFFIINSHL